MYNNKFGKSKELESGNKEVNARASYLQDILERDSLSSGSMHDYSEKNDR